MSHPQPLATFRDQHSGELYQEWPGQAAEHGGGSCRRSWLRYSYSWRRPRWRLSKPWSRSRPTPWWPPPPPLPSLSPYRADTCRRTTGQCPSCKFPALYSEFKSLLEGSEESVCTMCSNPVKLGDLLEVKDISSVLEASKSQET